MPESARNVLPLLPLFSPPRQKAFREAVAQTIRLIKAQRQLTNVELAEEIGVCPDTISNAENMNNDLSAVTLLRLGYEYGEDAIAPVLDLYRCRHASRAPESHLDAIQQRLDALRRELPA